MGSFLYEEKKTGRLVDPTLLKKQFTKTREFVTGERKQSISALGADDKKMFM